MCAWKSPDFGYGHNLIKVHGYNYPLFPAHYTQERVGGLLVPWLPVACGKREIEWEL